MTQHSTLTLERWSRFTLEQQVLMIANEMQRGAKRMSPGDRPSLKLVYERVLRLVDLTVSDRHRLALRRELLRWRGLIAELYLADAASPSAHEQALRCLLLFTPGSARQIPYLSDTVDRPKSEGSSPANP